MMPLTPEDILGIQQLIARYGFALDTGDVDGFAQCFTEDAFFDSPNHVCEGRADIVKGFIEDVLNTYGPTLRHTIHNFVIDGDGDTATMRCHVIIFRWTKNGLDSPFPPRTWENTLKKSNSGWQIHHHSVVHDAPA